MPNGTELHVGFFAPQSKHIWPTVSPWGVKWGGRAQGDTYFVGWLGFELGEDVLRLRLGGEGHGESEAAAMGTPDEDGGRSRRRGGDILAAVGNAQLAVWNTRASAPCRPRTRAMQDNLIR
jgi:hypothetical protein